MYLQFDPEKNLTNVFRQTAAATKGALAKQLRRLAAPVHH
jgi:hypothetical protein